MKKSILRNILMLPAAALMLASCATLNVTTDYDRTANFASMRTYAMYSGGGENKTISPLNADRITTAVRNELNAKGYTETTGTADFLVNVNTVVQEKQQLSANTDFYGGVGPYGYGGMYRPYGYWGGIAGGQAITTFNVDDYKDGSIIIDMIDPVTSKMFWEGTGNAEIDGNFNNPEKKIAAAIAKVLSSYPNAGAQPVQKK